MDFDFTEDQQSLREAVSRWVEKGYGFDRRRGIIASGGFSREAWGELCGLGLLGLVVPEGRGGMGFGAVEAMVVMEELGRGIVLEPYAAAALVAAPMLASSRAPAATDWLKGVLAGSSIVVLAHQERRARYRLPHVETQAKRDGTGNWLVSGTKSVVPAGEHAAAYIVPARVSGKPDDPAGIALFIVPRGDGVNVRGYPTQDGACAAEVRFDLARGSEVMPAVESYGALQAAIDRGIAALAAEAVGVMDQLVAVTVDYMNTRKQFGVPIGTFQALRHRIADVKMQFELARSMSYFASLKLGEAPAQRRRALSQAKVQLGHSMRFVGQQCIQLHGGVGVTDEYIASHYFKRLTVMELTYGDTMHHLAEVSTRMQDTAGVFA